jgi:hypothetical protein
MNTALDWTTVSRPWVLVVLLSSAPVDALVWATSDTRWNTIVATDDLTMTRLLRSCAILSSLRIDDRSANFTLELVHKPRTGTRHAGGALPGWFTPRGCTSHPVDVVDVAAPLLLGPWTDETEDVSDPLEAGSTRLTLFPTQGRLQVLRTVLNDDPRRTHAYAVRAYTVGKYIC